jgi:transposase
MLTQENDVEIHALAARGWNQSAISRHTGRDRKTVRKYLTAGTTRLVSLSRPPCPH